MISAMLIDYLLTASPAAREGVRLRQLSLAAERKKMIRDLVEEAIEAGAIAMTSEVLEEYRERIASLTAEKAS